MTNDGAPLTSRLSVLLKNLQAAAMKAVGDRDKMASEVEQVR